MDAKLKADWVKALRSGEYAQSRFRLKQVDGFCCLGVLCEVAGLVVAVICNIVMVLAVHHG